MTFYAFTRKISGKKKNKTLKEFFLKFLGDFKTLKYIFAFTIWRLVDLATDTRVCL